MANRTCSVTDCERPANTPGAARGWCGLHYGRWQRTGDPEGLIRKRHTCTIDGCDKPVNGRGLCDKHYSRWERYGDPNVRLRGEIRDGKRICPRCGEDVPLGSYSPGNNICKPCKAEYRRQRRSASPERREAMRAYARTYNAKHAERLREKARQWRTENREAVRAASARRRAVRNGATVEDFEHVEIFDRDNWTCHICGHRVSLVAKWPHPWSVSLDHIIPLSRGGEHSRQNVATACLRCNQRKYASMPD